MHREKKIKAVTKKYSGTGRCDTAQKTIPYEVMFPDGLCRLRKGRYSKSILFQDINYQLAALDDQMSAFGKFKDFYNFFDSSVDLQISLLSRYANRDGWLRSMELEDRDDGFNAIRKEYSEMLKNKMEYGSNSLEKTKILTITIDAKDEKEARTKLGRLELDAVNHLKIMGVGTSVLTGKERLEVLHSVMHPDGDKFTFAWKSLAESGLSTKDFIAPSSFQFGKSRTFRMGSKTGRVSYLQILAPELNDRILADFMDAEEGVFINLHVKPIDQAKALKTIKRKITDLDAMKIQEQKKASRDGYDINIIPSDLSTYGWDAKVLLEELSDQNEKMFLVTVLIMNIGNSRKELEESVARAARVAQQYNCKLVCLDFQQEEGFAATLPLGVNDIEIKRALTTKSTAIFVPFTTQELFQGGEAVYCGINSLSGNMIMCDRKKLKNPNGLILGTPGSGKSFAAKREIVNVMLVTGDDIIICDPEGEYSALVKKLNGQVIKISLNTNQYVNPMDINLDYADEDNPVALKSDFILSFCEIIMGGHDGLGPIHKTIIDRAVHQVYQPYFADPKPENMPILSDLYEEILRQDEPEAKWIASALELYVNGSLNIFNHRTNVDIKNRLVCFDIKELGKQLKQLGMLVIQDQVWNRVTKNRTQGKTTRYFIDEFHLLLKGEIAAWSVEIWKRFRKWGGIPTGITQNVKDFLGSSEVENIFGNSDYIYMLNQNAEDREVLAKALSISPQQLAYVTYSEAGEGLLFYGDVILTFVDKFPKDTEMYRVMTTKPDEVKADAAVF